MSVQTSPVSILTEDWFTGYTPREERLVVDIDRDILDLQFLGEFNTEADDYCEVTEDSYRNDASTLSWLHRDEDESHILMRWNQPDDVLDELDAIESSDQREVWVERMTAFRETQLRRLLKDYFGSDDYMNREIVLRWEQKDGRWRPAEKMLVREWVAQQIETRGSRLSAFSACAGTLRSRITRKRIANDKTGKSGSFARVYNAV